MAWIVAAALFSHYIFGNLDQPANFTGSCFLNIFFGLHVACMLDLKSFHGKMILDTFVDLSITELFINFVEKNIIMIY